MRLGVTEKGGMQAVGRRVLVIGKSLLDDNFETHVLQTLTELGCEAQCISNDGRVAGPQPWLRRIRQRVEGRIMSEPERRGERQFLRSVAKFAPDLILVLQGNYLSPKTVAALRKITPAPIACWCQDAISSYGRQYILGAEYDAVFVKDRYLQEIFSRNIRSTHFYYLPEACNPNVHRPIDLTSDEQGQLGCDVLMFGSMYYYRQEILRQLTGFDLRIYGTKPDWLLDRLGSLHRGGDLILQRKAKAVRAARVALNPIHCAEIDALNCRTFELAGCGAFQITTHKPVLAEHFRVGVEIESFESIEELRDKISYYVEHPQQAAEIARRGQERAHREHTYRHRLSVIMNTVLGLDLHV